MCCSVVVASETVALSDVAAKVQESFYIITLTYFFFFTNLTNDEHLVNQNRCESLLLCFVHHRKQVGIRKFGFILFGLIIE